MDIRAEIFSGPETRKSRLLIRKKPKQADANALTDVIIEREEPRRTDMRDEDRPVIESETLELGFRDRLHKVKLINLSGGGAMIETALKPNICERIDLHLAQDQRVECVVRWVKHGRLGLEFAHETHLECTEDKRNAVLAAAVSRLIGDEIEMVPLAPTADNRVTGRHPLIWCGELCHGGKRWAVRLRNISATGALLQCRGTLQSGWDVCLDLGEAGSLEASVSWVVGDHAGVHFAETFELEQLSNCKPRVTPSTWLRPAYLETSASAESAWDRPWSRMSLGELRTELEGLLKQ